MTLEINFKIPFMREFLLLHGVVDASKQACLMVLGKGSGQAILLAVGGAQESLLARPGTYDIVSGCWCHLSATQCVQFCHHSHWQSTNMNPQPGTVTWSM